MEEPPKKFFRLAPGREVRLRCGYFITCRKVIKDASGNVKELHCSYDPETRGGQAPDGRKVRGTIHWVSAKHAQKIEVRLYEHLFTEEDPHVMLSGEDWKKRLNPYSLKVLKNCFVEPSLTAAQPGDRYQFERLGYFCVDQDTTTESLVFNRTLPLKDSWKKLQHKQQ